MPTPTQYAPCTLCPRACQTNRCRAPGPFCNQTTQIKIARAAPHHWEEPCISGSRGSGTVFFSGCGLGCVFCQNHQISHGGLGRAVSEEELAALFLDLQAQGVHNLNLVTATHFAPGVLAALALAQSRGLRLPVVWNTGGYEAPATIEMLAPKVDIWLFDVKFHSSELSRRLASAPDYFKVASRAAQLAQQAAGPPQIGADGLMRRGFILRVLVLPGHAADAMALLDWAAQSLPQGGFLLSLMRQYTPLPGLAKPFNRPLSTYEYRKVADHALALGLTQGYTQQAGSAGPGYVPHFTGE